MANMMNERDELLAAKKAAASIQPALTVGAQTKVVAATEGILQAMMVANKKKKELEEVTSCMSPASKSMIMSTVVQEIVELGHKFKVMKEMEDDM